MGGIPQGPRPAARSCALFDTGTEPPWARRPENRIGEAASGVTGGGFSSSSRCSERAVVPLPLASGGRTLAIPSDPLRPPPYGTSSVSGQSLQVLLVLGGPRIIKKKN